MEENELGHEEQSDHAKESKIGLAEGLLLVLPCLLADILEIFAGFIALVPVVGLVAWFMAFILGMIVSAAVFVWSFMRGAKGNSAVKKLMSNGLRSLIVGSFEGLDIFTAGVLPARTIGILVAIIVNNFMANKVIAGALEAVEKTGVGKIAGKAASAVV